MQKQVIQTQTINKTGVNKASSNKANAAINLTYQLNQAGEQIYNCYQQEPLRMLFPKMYEIGIPGAILINTSGGVVGNDRHNINITLAKNTKTLITTQAAEKIYSSYDDFNAEISNYIKIADDSWIEWIPQETILFKGARLKRNLHFDVSDSSEVMAGEILVFGRVSRGEKFNSGFLRDEWAVRLKNNVIWKDILYLQEGITLNAMNHPAGFNGANSYGTFLYISSNAPKQLIKARKFLSCCQTKNYATSFDNLLLIRWLSSDPFQLRKDFTNFWRFWRQHVASLPSKLPRIWDF